MAVFALAAMAGFTDAAMREVCASFGCAAAATEMVSCRSLRFGADAAAVKELLERGAREKSLAVQLFGSRPEDFSEAVRVLNERYSRAFNCVEINMGCPAPKVTKTGAGSALLQDLPRAEAIIRETVRASALPVGVKTRTGWSEPSACQELARIAAGEGVAYVTVHGRTRAQMFAPPVDFAAIERVKRVDGLTVYGNGDVRTRGDARLMMELTGCDGVVIGRAALRAPWVFAELNGERVSSEAKLNAALWQARELVRRKGGRAVCELRGKLFHYLSSADNAKRYRQRVQQAETLGDVERVLTEFFTNA